MTRERERTPGKSSVSEAATGAPSTAPSLSPGRVSLVQLLQASSAAPSAESAGDIAARGTSGAASALPYRDRIQAAFGRHDISGVTAHTGAEATRATGALGAEAYASEGRVAFATSAPSLHTAAHEAAHVVQQRGGVQLKGGVGAAGDHYERHADAVADAVVAGQSAEALLDQHSGGGAAVQRVVQREATATAATVPEGPGLQQLRERIAAGMPSTDEAVAMISANPEEADAMLGVLEQAYGAAYTQQVLVAQQAQTQTPSATGPKPIVGAGSSYAANALPAAPKNPADKLSSNMSQSEADAQRAAVPPPPASIMYDPALGNKDAIERQQSPNYVNTGVSVQAPPGQVLPQSDTSTTANGTRIAGTSTETRGVGTMTTTVDGSKTVAVPTGFEPVDPAAQVAALARYRTAVAAALDEQIAASAPQHTRLGPAVPPEVKAQRDELKAAKEKVATASAAELDALVGGHKLLVAPPEDLRASRVTTSTSGVDASGLVTGGAIVANNEKTVTTQSAPGGVTTTKTDERTAELSTKGVNVGVGSSRTTADAAAGTVETKTSKVSVTGGGSDPLKAQGSYTTTRGDAASGTSTIANVTGGVQSGNGFGGVAGSASIGRGDAPAVAPAADGSAVATSGSDRRPSASLAGQAGVVQNEKGTGVTAGVTDARADVGTKTISWGGYGAADGSIQVLVTRTPDDGVILTFTAMVHAKVGAFLGKRGASEPVTTGKETTAAGGVYVAHNRVVTRTRKLSKDDAAKVLGDLDALASGVDSNGKKTFGTRAAAEAYTRVFGGHLEDLAIGDPKPGDGETISVQNETGGGGEVKAGASDGDGINARASVGITGGYEKLALSGREEVPTDRNTTMRLLFGARTTMTGGGSAGFGAASGTATATDMEQHTRTYVFTIPKDKPALLAQARAISDEQAAKDFAASHPELATGTVAGEIAQDGYTVGATVGPVGAQGGTTSTVDENIARGKQTVTGKDGKPHEASTVSGVVDGTREDKANASVLGVKVAQGQTTTTSHGVVDPDGQASLDVTTTSAESNAVDAVPKNFKANDKTDLAVAAATGGGPIGLLKKLAERVGELNTVGAHLDNAAFNALVGIAQEDPVAWSRAITTQYRSEWFALQNALKHPRPPQAWLDADESPDKAAANQLARMKAFASFVSVSGQAGQSAINRVRGEYGPNAIGETVSWPPSLQDQRPTFDALTKQVEHLKQDLTPYAVAGDVAGGNTYLDKLNTDLGELRKKIHDAPDHADATLGLRAANGIGEQQTTVATFKARFADAIAAHTNGMPAAEITKVLAGTAAKSVKTAEARAAASAEAWKAKQAADQLTPPADGASDAEWLAYNKRFAPVAAAEVATQRTAEQLRADENQQRASEAAAEANKRIPDFEQRCLGCKGSAFATLAQAANALPTGYVIGNTESTVKDKLLSLGNQMRQWKQDWDALARYYKDAGMPDGHRVDLKPALEQAPFTRIAANEYLSANWKGYAGELRNQWATLP